MEWNIRESIMVLMGKSIGNRRDISLLHEYWVIFRSKCKQQHSILHSEQILNFVIYSDSIMLVDENASLANISLKSTLLLRMY